MLSSFRDLYRKHHNTPVVVLGNGASLVTEDLSNINNLTTVACNSKIWIKQFYDGKKNPIIPKYVVLSEGQSSIEPSKGSSIVCAENISNTRFYEEHKNIENFYRFSLNKKEEAVALSMAENPNWKSFLRSIVPGITGPKNDSLYYAFGGMVSAINLAHHLGSNEIYLLGFDGRSVDGRWHFWPDDDDNMYSNQSSNAQRILHAQIKYLHVCKTIFESNNTKIYCSSKNSLYLKALDYKQIPPS